MGLKNLHQATIWLNTKDACLGWFMWYKEKGVPCAIIKSDSGYAVFRILKGNVEEPIRGVYDVLFPCNGFSMRGEPEKELVT